MGRPFLRVSLGSVVTVTLVYDCKKSLQTIKKDRFLNTSKSRFDSVCSGSHASEVHQSRGDTAVRPPICTAPDR